MNIQYYKLLSSMVLLSVYLINISVSMTTQESERLFFLRQISSPARLEKTSISQNITPVIDDSGATCFPFSFFNKKQTKVIPLPLKENNAVPLAISPLKNNSFEQNSMNSSYLSLYQELSFTALQKGDSNNLNKNQPNFTNEFNRLGAYSADRTSQSGMLMYSLKNAQFFMAVPFSYNGESITIKPLSKGAGKRCLACEGQVSGTYIFGSIK